MSTAVAPVSNPTGVQQPAEVARVRVAIMIAHYQVDVVMPTKFSVETFIDDLLAVLASAIDDESVEFTPIAGQWTLAQPGMPPIPRWRTLADYDVVDGAVLMLTTVESTEIFVPVVEDITDALAFINQREFGEFDSGTAAVVGHVALALGAFTIAGLLSWSWSTTASVLWCAVPALVLGALCWFGAEFAARRAGRTSGALSLALAALPLLSTGVAMLVPPPYGHPGWFGADNIAAGAAVLAVVAAVLLRSIRIGTPALIAATTVGIVGAVASDLVSYLDLSVRQIAGGTALAALIMLTTAPRLAVVVARIRPPDLPDPGRELGPGTLTDIFDAESVAPESIEEPDGPAEQPYDRPGVRLEAHARLAVTSLRGLFLADSLLLGLSAVLVMAAEPGGIRGIVLAVAVAGLLAMRARWHPDRMQAVTLLGGAVLTVLGMAAVLIGGYGSAPARATVVLMVAAAAAAGSVAGVKLPGIRLSPVVRRVIDLVEFALILVVPALACWTMGIYTAMRAI
ncbi:type VII secretion integral membrane protein EccD [Nocardia sp. NBC_00511]|uniref:type VII secretion integral membrane protein EccD n=1 Tax=Nocardia sp. NBC_00511 TaxID=2903591 RepID=UPI002F9175A4